MSCLALFSMLAQMSTGRTYPSAALWFFSAILVVAFGIILLFEGLDLLHAARRALARRLRGDTSVADLATDLQESDRREKGEGVHLEEPETKLRRRFFRRVRPIRRTWEGGQANSPSRHWWNRTSW